MKEVKRLQNTMLALWLFVLPMSSLALVISLVAFLPGTWWLRGLSMFLVIATSPMVYARLAQLKREYREQCLPTRIEFGLYLGFIVLTTIAMSSLHRPGPFFGILLMLPLAPIVATKRREELMKQKVEQN